VYVRRVCVYARASCNSETLAVTRAISAAAAPISRDANKSVCELYRYFAPLARFFPTRRARVITRDARDLPAALFPPRSSFRATRVGTFYAKRLGTRGSPALSPPPALGLATILPEFPSRKVPSGFHASSFP